MSVKKGHTAEERFAAFYGDEVGSKTVLICFGGLSHGFGMTKKFEWLRSTAHLGVDRMFVRDNSMTWYWKDLPMFEKKLQEIVKRYKKVVMIGSSAGGYAAMMFGHKLKANRVLAFGPQTFLDRKNRQQKKDMRWERWIRIIRTEIGIWFKRYTDLQFIMEKWNGKTEYEIHYCQNHKWDARHANYASKLPHVKLVPHKLGGHNPAKELRGKGKLEEIIKCALK